MAAFQETREDTEQKVFVHLLSEIERNPTFTQRRLARELNIALGLMNQYLKRFIAKGWLRATQVSPRRIKYFITPTGLKEKGSMVRDYLSRSLSFFRDARQQCEEVITLCQHNQWTSVALVGQGDLSDIMMLVAQGNSLTLKVVDITADFSNFDAVMVTDILDPYGVYKALEKLIHPNHLITIPLLHITRSTKESLL
ncbi:MAG: winged helix-turn-helix transcriptional regulator [Candidatus Paracaedibacteraceae bacterium]|nr:winged helix-turn-helix transcriptional regulator [Candidatus Paracaedibacteraceae bacterium]